MDHHARRFFLFDPSFWGGPILLNPELLCVKDVKLGGPDRLLALSGGDGPQLRYFWPEIRRLSVLRLLRTWLY